jgi:hypothetical protein
MDLGSPGSSPASPRQSVAIPADSACFPATLQPYAYFGAALKASHACLAICERLCYTGIKRRRPTGGNLEGADLADASGPALIVIPVRGTDGPGAGGKAGPSLEVKP